MAKLDDYFARKLKVDNLMGKVDAYYQGLETLNYSKKISRCYNQYYGQGHNGVTDRITPGGTKGELSNYSVNNFRALMQHQLTLVTSDRPAFDVRAINTDSKSQKQSVLGGDVLDYYLSKKRLETVLIDATEKSLYSSEGWVEIYWDSRAGEPYGVDPDTDEQRNTGDVQYRTYDCLDVIRDFRQPEGLDWVILRQTHNKYDLAARYPEHEEKILNSELRGSKSAFNRTRMTINSEESDMIYVYQLYHKKMPILPEGVYAIFIEDEILEQGPLPLTKSDELPVFRIMPGKLQNYGLGYTQAFDIVGLQEIGDQLYQAVISNNLNFSRQNLLIHKDADLNVNEIGEGMTALMWDGENKPEALQLVASSPETYSLIDRVEGLMEKFTGINEVIRGDPSPNLRSGNALALVAAQSIKFNSTLQNSFYKLLEDVGTGTLFFLKEFSEDVERFVTIVGIHNKSYLKAFKGKDLDGVSRVEVKTASALSKTSAGKVEIANNLIQNKLVDAKGYMSVLETGELDILTEDPVSEEINIKQENEWMMDGKRPQALMFDNHPVHIKKHKAIIDDPEVRQSPEEIQAVLDHMQEHLDLWLQMDPNILAALGIQPPQAPPQQAPQGGGGPAGAPPVNPLTQGQEPSVEQLPALPNVPEGSPPGDAQALQELGLEAPV